MARTVANAAVATVFALAVLSALTGCADNRPLVTWESSAEQRGPATEKVVLATTLRDSPDVTFVDSQLRDACGADPRWFQSESDGTGYRCGVGRISVYSITADDGLKAATFVDRVFEATGCVSAHPLASDPDLAISMKSSRAGAHAIETAFDCERGGGLATLGLASDRGIRSLIDAGAATPGLDGPVDEDPIEQRLIDDLATSRQEFALVLESSIVYYETTICDGLHRCGPVTKYRA